MLYAQTFINILYIHIQYDVTSTSENTSRSVLSDLKTRAEGESFKGVVP